MQMCLQREIQMPTLMRCNTCHFYTYCNLLIMPYNNCNCMWLRHCNSEHMGAHGSIVGWGTMQHARRLWDRIPMRSLDFSMDLILPATLWPQGDSASKRNEYQEFSWGVKGGRHLRLTTLPLSMSQLSRKCGILDLSQHFGPPWSVTGTALPFNGEYMFFFHLKV
jgi:hypothetical protein